jgi:branched-chain amino acid transport system substrate-binding protein
MSGQNERSYPVVMQYVGGETKVSWPASIRTADPVMPLPAGNPYSTR